jgi:hypothetical protein
MTPLMQPWTIPIHRPRQSDGCTTFPTPSPAWLSSLSRPGEKRIYQLGPRPEIDLIMETTNKGKQSPQAGKRTRRSNQVTSEARALSLRS